MASKWSYLKWRSYKLRKRVIRAWCSQFYQDTNRDLTRSIFIAGTARSGTTWLASLIASQLTCRIMFEPFHSKQVAAFQSFHYFHYMRPDVPNEKLLEYCYDVLTGHIRHPWIDRQVEHLFPQSRLIKAIRANLFLKWLQVRFPEVPLILILRHPCAVVHSRMQLGWATDTDIAPFLEQETLAADFLEDKLDFIKSVESVAGKHALIWCISYLVPLSQFQPGELNLCFYENLCLHPEIEIPHLFHSIGYEYQNSVFDEVGQPSTTTLPESAILSGADKISHWKKALSSADIDAVLTVVAEFGLDNIYDDSPIPKLKPN